jgi:predicted DsbA family dithiol-disulfide isomerase
MTAMNKPHCLDDPTPVLHWYDFICPFCYLGQQRNAILRSNRIKVVELPFQAHPDIPLGGIPAGRQRSGQIYAMLEREAEEAGLQLNWPQRLPNTRMALAAAEWTRQHCSSSFAQFHRELFEAHFALNEDLEDPAVIDRHASGSGVDLVALHTGLADGTAMEAVTAAEMIGRKYGVQGTPAWLFAQGLIMGLRTAGDFERLADEVMRLAP